VLGLWPGSALPRHNYYVGSGSLLIKVGNPGFILPDILFGMNCFAAAAAIKRVYFCYVSFLLCSAVMK
jgi:hypothetical protein